MARNIDVFVYGTLKQGYGNHRLLLDANFEGTKSVDGFDLYDLGPFPAVVPNDRRPHERAVVGEHYKVNAEEFKHLDSLEGYPHFYTRSRVVLDDGSEAWIYHFDPKDGDHRGRLIESGEWRPQVGRWR